MSWTVQHFCLGRPACGRQRLERGHRRSRANPVKQPVIVVVADADADSAPSSSIETRGSLQRAFPSPALLATRRGVALGTLASVVTLVFDGPGEAAPPARLLPLNVYLDSIRAAKEELQTLQSKIDQAAASTTPLPFSELQNSLQTGQLGRLREASIGADEYLGEDNLEAWEEAAWEAMPQAEDQWRDGMRDAGDDSGTRITKLRFNMPGMDRTNALTCLVFSCFNDPRQPPSTNHMLTFKMLQDGVSMGARGDKRITPEGLSLIIDDLQGDLQRFLSLATDREALYRSLSEQKQRQN